jgi:hypothetical protein
MHERSVGRAFDAEAAAEAARLQCGATQVTAHHETDGFPARPAREPQRYPCVPRPSAAPTLHGHNQITDAYLLALAVRHRGTLVTLDRAITLDAVHGAKPQHLIIV